MRRAAFQVYLEDDRLLTSTQLAMAGLSPDLEEKLQELEKELEVRHPHTHLVRTHWEYPY